MDTLEDLAFVKALVIEAIKPDGYAILNADDPFTEMLMERVRCHVVLFSRYNDSPLLKKHIEQGEMAIFIKNRQIYIYEDNRSIFLLEVDQIPLTFAGQAAFNIENSLAAAAGLAALKTEHDLIRRGLKSFMPDEFFNAGRVNLFDLHGFQVLLDYGHNLSGYDAVIRLAKSLEHDRLVGVIGMPGDRSNEAIFAAGKLCGQSFDRLYIKEDGDLRGREKGVAASILYHGAVSGSTAQENIEIILSETDALETAINAALAGDLIVMFYENHAAVSALVQNYIKLCAQPMNIYPPVIEGIPAYLPDQLLPIDSL